MGDDPSDTPDRTSGALERFEALAKRLLSVPKKDVSKKERERIKNGLKRKPA